jgi:hypothetical protein
MVKKENLVLNYFHKINWLYYHKTKY